MATLLRREAIERRQVVHVRSMFVQLDLTDLGSFTSRTVIEFDATPGASTFVDFAADEVIDIDLNGRPLAPDTWDGARIALSDLEASNQLTVVGVMAYGNDGEGLHSHVDPADGNTYLYAMSFLDAGPKWFACFDQPDLKSPYIIDVTTPDDWVVRGIGPATQLGPGHWRVDQPRPLSTYLVSIVAGPWVSITDEHDGIALSVLARASMADQLASQADDIFAVTKACFTAYHELFDEPYAFGEYHQVFAPDFNAAAMENPGCVIFRDQLLFRGTPTHADRAGRAAVIAHEMAHQWFGDLVTMRWWDDLWLNESFAEYMGHRICSEVTEYELWTEFGAARKNWGSVADQSPATHPIAFNGAESSEAALANFDGISYAKGASVLRQLAAALGDEVFFGGLNAYFAAHRFDNAELGDLIAAWTAAGAEGLDNWVDEWLSKPNMDVLRPVQTPDGWAIERIVPADHPADRMHAIRCVEIGTNGEIIAEQDVVVRGDHTPLGLAGDGIIIPDALDMTWARIRPSSWQLPGPAAIDSAPTRVVVLNGLRDGVRNGDLSSSHAFRRIINALPHETNVVIMRSALDAARLLCGMWCPPEDRQARRAELAALCLRMLDGLPKGSDAELVLAKAVIGASDDIDLLMSWLEAGRAYQRYLEPDVRWALVTRLMSLGGDPALIAAELGRDTSTAGYDAAAGARAAIGTPEAKELALESVLEPGDHRAYELYAIGAHLFLPDQYDLMQPYVASYFERLPAMASYRSGWALKLLVARSFPAAMVDADTLALAEGVLARDDLHEGLRRALIEPVHQLEQAVRSTTAEREARQTGGQ